MKIQTTREGTRELSRLVRGSWELWRKSGIEKRAGQILNANKHTKAKLSDNNVLLGEFQSTFQKDFVQKRISSNEDVSPGAAHAAAKFSMWKTLQHPKDHPPMLAKSILKVYNPLYNSITVNSAGHTLDGTANAIVCPLPAIAVKMDSKDNAEATEHAVCDHSDAAKSTETSSKVSSRNEPSRAPLLPPNKNPFDSKFAGKFFKLILRFSEWIPQDLSELQELSDRTMKLIHAAAEFFSSMM